jgi:hypothetical protein
LRFSLPVPVTRKRFLTLLLVFCFGMGASGAGPPAEKSRNPWGVPRVPVGS